MKVNFTFENDVCESVLDVSIGLGPADVATGVRVLRITDDQSAREGTATQRVGDDLVVVPVAVGDDHAILEPRHFGVDGATEAALQHQFVAARVIHI